jgi:spermidine synthase
MKRAAPFYYALLFLLSGFSSLVYQVVWQRILQTYFGVATLSITLIVAAYMCGLGLGYLLGGRLAQRARFPLVAYGWIEISLGFFGLFSPFLLQAVGQVTAGSPFPVVFLISFAVLLTPTILMGATLPLLSQSFVRRVDTSGQVIGLLYGLNTLGAALGALVSAFLLIGYFGLGGTILIAAATNLLIGLAALTWTRFMAHPAEGEAQAQPDAAEPEPAAGKEQAGGWGYSKILAAAGLIGFIGLGYEMIWVRMLGVLNKHTAYSFPAILFFLLVGLALGGYLFGRRADRSSRPTRLLWQVEISAAVLAGASVLVYLAGLQIPALRLSHAAGFYDFQHPPSPYVLAGGNFVFSIQSALAGLLEFIFPILLIVLPASLFHGGALVILDRIAIDSPHMAGRRVGDVHLANIIGALGGTLLVSLVLVPAIGIEWMLKILVLLSGLFLAFDLSGSEPNPTGSRLRGAVLPAGVLVAVALLLPWRTGFYRQVYEAGLGRVPVLLEGRDSLMALTREEAPPNQLDELWLGGELHSVFGPASTIYQTYALNCISSVQPKSVLIIGLGGGNTAKYYLESPGVERVVIVELLEGLDGFLEENIPWMGELLADPRVTYHVDDGRRYLYANPDERFDLIAIDPLRHYTAGASNLYSQEALELYRDHLQPGGLLCAWMDEFHTLPKTAAGVFPHVDEFLNQILASSEPLDYSAPVLQQRAAAAGLAVTPGQIFGLFKRDRSSILEGEANTPGLSDMDPHMEYYFFRRPPEQGPRLDRKALRSFFERVDGCDELCRSAITGP